MASRTPSMMIWHDVGGSMTHMRIHIHGTRQAIHEQASHRIASHRIASHRMRCGYMTACMLGITYAVIAWHVSVPVSIYTTSMSPPRVDCSLCVCMCEMCVAVGGMGCVSTLLHTCAFTRQHSTRCMTRTRHIHAMYTQSRTCVHDTLVCTCIRMIEKRVVCVDGTAAGMEAGAYRDIKCCS